MDGAGPDGQDALVAGRRVIERGGRCAAHRPLLVCTDGLCSSIRAIRTTFHDPVHASTKERLRLRPWRNVCMAQVVKRYLQRRIVDVERRNVPVRSYASRRSDAAPVRGTAVQRPLRSRAPAARTLPRSALENHRVEAAG